MDEGSGKFLRCEIDFQPPASDFQLQILIFLNK